MKQVIQQHLREIEAKYNIKILLACETGSRAWGFASPDSDYDVRIIYAHPQDWYLSLNERKDTIDLMLENREVDISGWDIRKALRLLIKSNAPLLDRIYSPVVYNADEDFVEEIKKLSEAYYSRIATMYHYLGMCKKSFESIEGTSSFKLKKLFYALRTATICRWVIEREDIPPVNFLEVLEGVTSMDVILKDRVKELIELKSTKDETYLHTGEKALFDFIRDAIQWAEEKGKQLPAGNGDIKALDAFYRKTIQTAL